MAVTETSTHPVGRDTVHFFSDRIPAEQCQRLTELFQRHAVQCDCYAVFVQPNGDIAAEWTVEEGKAEMRAVAQHIRNLTIGTNEEEIHCEFRYTPPAQKTAVAGYWHRDPGGPESSSGNWSSTVLCTLSGQSTQFAVADTPENLDAVMDTNRLPTLLADKHVQILVPEKGVVSKHLCGIGEQSAVKGAVHAAGGQSLDPREPRLVCLLSLGSRSL
jgi:hypothetical protein